MQQRHKPASIQPKVRLPADLHKRLWQAAGKGGRTLNAEIVYRLAQSFDQPTVDQLIKIADAVLQGIQAQIELRGIRAEKVARAKVAVDFPLGLLTPKEAKKK